MAEKKKITIENLTELGTKEYVEVEVSQEVYNELRRSEWREEKVEYRDSTRKLSSDYEYEDGVTMKDFLADPNPTPEDVMVKKAETMILHEAMNILSEEKRWLIEQLYFCEKTERQLEKETGIPRTTINSRRKKALEEMKEYMKKRI